MKRPLNRLALALALMVLAAASFAATAPLVSWSDPPADEYVLQHERRVSGNPGGLSLELSLGGETYYRGQTIRISLTFKNSSEEKYSVSTATYDRSGRIQDIAFHVDGPETGYADPLADYFTRGWVGGGLSGADADLGEYTQTFDLNEWVRFDHPGQYRVYCTTTRPKKKDQPHGYITLYSQMVSLSVTEASDNWVQSSITSALTDVHSDDPAVRRNGVRRLRFLSRPDSVAELVPLLGERDLGSQALFGVVGYQDWPHVRKVLSEGIRAPDIPVNETYLRALTHVSTPPDKHIVTPDVDDMAGIRRHKEQLQGALTASSDALLAQLAQAIPEKRDRALAVSCALLLEHKQEAPDLRRSLARSFHTLTKKEQETLLRYRWESIRCSEFESPLHLILQTPPGQEQWIGPRLHSLALLRYQEYQPEEAKALILEDIKRPSPLLSEMVLTSLADECLPELDDLLLVHLRGSYKVASLVERYASAKILPEVIHLYTASEGRWACAFQDSLLRYWLKHDRANGMAAVLRASHLRESTGCYRTVLGQVLASSYGPDTERLALPFLNDGDSAVVVDVVQLIGREGTEKTINSLLTCLESVETGNEDRPMSKSFNREHVHGEIVRCLLNRDDWKFTGTQREILRHLLRNGAEKRHFERRFGTTDGGNG